MRLSVSTLCSFHVPHINSAHCRVSPSAPATGSHASPQIPHLVGWKLIFLFVNMPNFHLSDVKLCLTFDFSRSAGPPMCHKPFTLNCSSVTHLGGHPAARRPSPCSFPPFCMHWLLFPSGGGHFSVYPLLYHDPFWPHSLCFHIATSAVELPSIFLTKSLSAETKIHAASRYLLISLLLSITLFLLVLTFHLFSLPFMWNKTSLFIAYTVPLALSLHLGFSLHPSVLFCRLLSPQLFAKQKKAFFLSHCLFNATSPHKCSNEKYIKSPFEELRHI